MLLPGDLVVWDNELSLLDSKEVGNELASLGEISHHKIETLPHIILTKEAFSFFLESDNISQKIKHLLGTLNHDRHESIAQVSGYIKKFFSSASFPNEIHTPLSTMLDALPVDVFSLKVYYFDNDKLIGANDIKNIKGDAVVAEKVKEAWKSLYSAENIANFQVHHNNHHRLSVVVAIAPMLDFALTGYVKNVPNKEHVIEAHKMTRYSFSKVSKRIEEAVVLPGGSKNALSVKEIKILLDISHLMEKLFYTSHTAYWGKYKNEVYVTGITPTAQLHKDTFNTLIDAVTVHPGITVGTLRVISDLSQEKLEFSNEILIIENLDKKMVEAIKNVKGLILKKKPHPEVGQLLAGYGIPTVVREDNKILYSTGDVVSLNATTGEIKRGNMLVT